MLYLTQQSPLHTTPRARRVPVEGGAPEEEAPSVRLGRDPRAAGTACEDSVWICLGCKQIRWDLTTVNAAAFLNLHLGDKEGPALSPGHQGQLASGEPQARCLKGLQPQAASPATAPLPTSGQPGATAPTSWPCGSRQALRVEGLSRSSPHSQAWLLEVTEMQPT